MAARTTLANLITRLRRMVDDVASGVWTDEELQQILDSHRENFFRERLTTPFTGTATGNGRVYLSKHSNLEEKDVSDDSIFRLFSSAGVDASGYTPDYVGGQFVFASDQAGAVYYLDGRDYDLNAAAAECWREAAGSKAKLYTFADAGLNKYDRSDWFKHCQEMIKMFEQKARMTQSRTIRA